jgi:hypothetical protein
MRAGRIARLGDCLGAAITQWRRSEASLRKPAQYAGLISVAGGLSGRPPDPAVTKAASAARSRPTRFAFSFMHSPTISAIFCACWRRPSRVADEPEGKANQDRRQGRQSWPLCRVPNGRGRYSPKSLRGHSAADHQTEAAAAHINSVMRSVSRVPSKTKGKVRLDDGNRRISSPRWGRPRAQTPVEGRWRQRGLVRSA